MPQDFEANTDGMFPKLGPAAIERLLRIGRRRQARPSEILFEAGEPARSVFVLLEGRIEIVSPRSEGELVIRRLEPGEFTGEVATLLGRPALARAPRSKQLRAARTRPRPTAGASSTPTPRWARCSCAPSHSAARP
jgi:hypothetical protein